MYGNQYGNPFAFQQFQQAQPQMQAAPPQRPLPGRVVGGIAEVTPSDVPMDGRTSWFPAADGSMVWGRAWTADGTIRTTAYAPVEQPDAPEGRSGENPVLDAILERLTAIEDALRAKPKKRKEADEPSD